MAKGFPSISLKQAAIPGRSLVPLILAPVIGGLFDPRMGVLEPGLICPTDGYTYIDTPGYFGHIELARPVFAIQHIKEVVKINELDSAYIRPLIFFGEGEMGLLPNNVPVRVSIAAWYWGAYLGDDAVNRGVNVCISKWRRISPTSFIPLAKGVGGYMNSTLAKIDAVDNGYDDAIMLGDDGTVAEGSGQNIFIVKDGNIFTPPNTTGALNGITRRTVIEISKNNNIPIDEKNYLIVGSAAPNVMGSREHLLFTAVLVLP